MTAGQEVIMDRQSNKITALYCRLASYHEGPGTNAGKYQMERLRLYTEAHGLQNPKFFCDWGFYGNTQDRPEYQRIIREVRAGTVSGLVVTDFSRLGRRYAVCRELLESILPKYSVTLHSVKDGAIYTPQDLEEMAARSRAFESLCLKSLRKGGRG